MARRRQLPVSARDWLRRRLRAARDLLAAIEQRQETLARVARATLGHQRAFLERGMASLRPLRMQVVADELGLHLSTVSRAVADKSVQTDLGVFPLRQLFDGKAVGGTAEGEGESRRSVQARIRELVDGEDPAAPLSDQAIVACLRAEGLDVARRTVAKCRQELGIASRWRRRAF
jgi:RNA polymerase sigma-54 factor